MGASGDWDLRREIREVLASDEEVRMILGGAPDFEDRPENASYPYLTLAQTPEQDWTTGTEDPSKQTVTLHIWSRAGGKRKTQEIIDKVRSALHDSELTLDEHRSVRLRHEFSEARHDEDGETYHGLLRYRAEVEATKH